MIFVSDTIKKAPDCFKSPLHEMVYEALDKLQIPFERVDTDEAITMEDCINIGRRLEAKVVKTLFLCNSQKTEFYIFVTTADKPFKTKNFSRSLGVSRVSFAPSELLEGILGVKIGAATIFGALRDADNRVKVVLDKDVLSEEWYGCSDGTTTGYMKVRTKDILDKLLPYTKHIPAVIEI